MIEEEQFTEVANASYNYYDNAAPINELMPHLPHLGHTWGKAIVRWSHNFSPMQSGPGNCKGRRSSLKAGTISYK